MTGRGRRGQGRSGANPGQRMRSQGNDTSRMGRSGTGDVNWRVAVVVCVYPTRAGTVQALIVA
jgi:hypothetical protein